MTTGMTASTPICWPIKSLNAAANYSGANEYITNNRWMIVDGEGKFVSKKMYETLALIKLIVCADGTLFFHAPPISINNVPYKGVENANKIKVSIREFYFNAEDQGSYIADQLIAFFRHYAPGNDLGKCRLVRIPDEFMGIVSSF